MQKSDELKKFIVEFYKNMSNSDYFSNKIIDGEEAIIIGSDELEWITGHEKVISSLKKLAETLKGAKITEYNPNVYAEGKTAWFNDRLTVDVNNHQIHMRATGVVVKEEESWKIAQMHFSIGIPNENTAFGKVNIVD